MMLDWPLICALCCALLMMLPTMDAMLRVRRVHDCAVPRPRTVRPPMGLDAALTMLISSVRSGSTLEEGLIRLSPEGGGADGGRGDGNGADSAGTQLVLDEYAVSRALADQTRGDEMKYLGVVAGQVCAVASLSKRLGCELAACLEAVAVAYRSAVERDQLIAQATAMPKATVKLLLALPLGTWGFGALLGADPLAALFASPIGWICLLFGVGGYVAGGLWVRAMLRTIVDEH